MKIAVIGSGIAGMAAAHFLAKQHDVTMYEAADRLGGHTATVDVDDEGQTQHIDTGFIVFNDWTYPHFIALLQELGVDSRPTSMSFSVSDAISGLEYAGTNLNTLFAQRLNLLSPRFLRLVKDIVRFNREVEHDLLQNPALASRSLGQYLREYRYSSEFRDYYLLPMGAAIWSSSYEDMESFPLHFFVQFFRNHGLLNFTRRPQWRVITGGSRQYIAPLTRSFRNNIRLSTPVTAVRRYTLPNGAAQASVASSRGEESFDHVILACHSNQALKMLSDATPAEREILAAIPCSRNEVVLHTDDALLPNLRRTWSSWNVRLGHGNSKPALTYNMNILQGLQSRRTWCVTLNQTGLIRESCIKAVFHYDHPVFTLEGIKAQQRWQEINGTRNTWYCGAWWRNGFHEDGVWSARRVADQLQQQTLVAHVPPLAIAS
jgi:predicted NAD/FAD-binding protein